MAPSSLSLRAGLGQIRPHGLGPVDGFDQDEATRETNESGIAFRGLFAAHGDTLEAFQLAHGLLDPSAGLVEQLWKETRLVLRVLTVRDHWKDAALAAGSAVRRRVIALVGDCRARRDVGTDVEGGFELGAVADLAAGQMEGDGQAVEIRLEVDFAREAAP